MATAWMVHLKKCMKANPGKTLGDCMKIAKKTYKKGHHGGGMSPADVEASVSAAPLPGGDGNGGAAGDGVPGGAMPATAGDSTSGNAAVGGRRRTRRYNKGTRKTRRGRRTQRKY